MQDNRVTLLLAPPAMSHPRFHVTEEEKHLLLDRGALDWALMQMFIREFGLDIKTAVLTSLLP